MTKRKQPAGQVIDLMSALKASLAEGEKAKVIDPPIEELVEGLSPDDEVTVNVETVPPMQYEAAFDAVGLRLDPGDIEHNRVNRIIEAAWLAFNASKANGVSEEHAFRGTFRGAFDEATKVLRGIIDNAS